MTTLEWIWLKSMNNANMFNKSLIGLWLNLQRPICKLETHGQQVSNWVSPILHSSTVLTFNPPSSSVAPQPPLGYQTGWTTGAGICHPFFFLSTLSPRLRLRLAPEQAWWSRTFLINNNNGGVSHLSAAYFRISSWLHIEIWPDFLVNGT